MTHGLALVGGLLCCVLLAAMVIVFAAVVLNHEDIDSTERE